jgi:DNA polymerase I-like protein with 3'-5' exonuclease and polymerase domains
MKIKLGRVRYRFWPWTVASGRVFNGVYAFDSETTRIDEEHPWISPAYVLGAAFDGRQGYFIPRDRAEAFFTAHSGTPIVFHNAPFDLAVLHTLAPDMDVYGKVDKDQVWDTQLLHRLYVLGTDGHPASGRGESTLEHCAEHYLGVRLAKDVVDSKGDLVRLSYSRWLNRPAEEIEQVYLKYLGEDTIATFLVYQDLRRRMTKLLEDSQRVWGFAAEEWLAEQVHRWGPQTHHIQLRAAVVLREITANGLHLDMARRAQLVQSLEAALEPRRAALRKYGYLPGRGSGKALQGILRRLERNHPEIEFPRTDTELYATSHEALQELIDVVPFVKLLMEYRETDKLLKSFVEKMNRGVLHASFNVLARTGRTTSFGEINAQNLPTDDEVRSCFVPSHGNVFIDADYKTIELATLAEACVGQFGLESKMAEAINAGKDLHTWVAARVTGKPEADVTKAERQNAKPINFGKPGGMGNRTMKAYANANYGVRLTDDEVEALSEVWFEVFPEMREYLSDATDTGLEFAKLFRLTPASHYEHTGDRRFVGHPANHGRGHRPHAILGAMCMKVLGTPDPQTQAGKPYPPGDIDYFWTRVEERINKLPKKLRQAVRDRQPSPRLRRAAFGLVGRGSVFTLTGRLRANASYCARHNTVFQGLAADGAKLALWLLWRAGYRIVNFIHDQVLVEVPADSNLRWHAERIRRLLIEGMRQVVPDVHVDVSYAATARWYKDAEAVFGGRPKKLLLWSPPTKKENQSVAG